MKKKAASKSLNITLVGCGNMGGALLQGWLKKKLPADYLVIKPNPLPAKFKSARVTHITAPDKTVLRSDIIVLAVKPQILGGVLQSLKEFVPPEALIISTAAGWTLARLEESLSRKQPIVRALPNLPAAIGKGMTLAVPNASAQDVHKAQTDKLFECVGLLEWLEIEKLMNAASMLSGAGPAFPFFLTEVLARAGERNGVPGDLAKRIARQTVIGAAALMEARDSETPESLRQGVTSPGGVTEAALRILMNGLVQKQFDDAIKAGARRGEELNK